MEKKDFTERVLQRLGVLQSQVQGLMEDITPKQKPVSLDDLATKLNVVHNYLNHMDKVAHSDMDDCVSMLVMIVVLLILLIILSMSVHGHLKVLFQKIVEKRGVVEIDIQSSSTSSSSLSK